MCLHNFPFSLTCLWLAHPFFSITKTLLPVLSISRSPYHHELVDIDWDYESKVRESPESLVVIERLYFSFFKEQH